MFRKRYLFFALVWLIIILGSAKSFAQKIIGATENVSISTPHPYPNGDPSQPVVWSHTITHPGATFIKVHFKNMSIEGEMPEGPSDIEEAFSKDYVSILDANGKEVDRLTGTGDKWALSVPGNTVIIELHADGQNAQYGFDIDRYAWGFEPMEPESICDGNGLTSICDAVVPGRIRLSDPVARLVYVDDCTGDLFTCTGFLFTEEGFFMTNAHCADSHNECESAEVRFNEQRADCTLAGRPSPDTFRCRSHVQTTCDLDLSVLEVFDPAKGNPAPIYGFMTLSDRVPAAGEAIWVPQHPGGRPKEISEDGIVTTVPIGGRDPCRRDPPFCESPPPFLPTGRNTDFGHRADTERGSSGSPVMDNNNLVIGLHHAGGCTETGENVAVLMSEILPHLYCTFSTIDFPGAALTVASGINSAGEIVGTYHEAGQIPDTVHGFLLSGGTFSTIDFPGALVTRANGINDVGQIMGGYFDSEVDPITGEIVVWVHGFLLSGGIFSTIDFPGDCVETRASGINDVGQVVGTYNITPLTPPPCNFEWSRGFLLSGGIFSTINFPGAFLTEANGINNVGQIVGQYVDVSGGFGFLLSGGIFSTIDFPGAFGTHAHGINDVGQIVGTYNSTSAIPT